MKQKSTNEIKQLIRHTIMGMIVLTILLLMMMSCCMVCLQYGFVPHAS